MVLLGFLPTFLRQVMIRTHVRRAAPDWDPLKDALPTQLRHRGSKGYLTEGQNDTFDGKV